jgi:S-adenosylmethionine synthetase
METVAKGKLILAGELTTTATIDAEAIARKTVRQLGYTIPALGFTDACDVKLLISQQSPEISQGVDNDGAGDQGMMFGYACRQTEQLMPLPIALAHSLAYAIDSARESGSLPYLRPDGKTQVTVQYENGQPVGVDSIVIAVPHDEKVSHEQLEADLRQRVIEPTLHSYNVEPTTFALVINGTGVWHIGGPASDAGLTGRKIVVDGYGGYARVGGGAFSGKDPSKVDRSGAYAARYLAKNIVAHGLADEAEVRLAYVIGQAKPLMQQIETFGTAKQSESAIQEFCRKLLDTSVQGIIEGLELRRPIYAPTAAYGHFGRDQFPWEKIAEI